MNRFFLGLAWLACLASVPQTYADTELRAGAAAIDVTPVHRPVVVNGGMFSRTVDAVKSRLHARAIVLDDGHHRIAIVVVDSCMMPSWLLDEAKQLAAQRTNLRPDQILISATHTHSAPSSFACLGTDADPVYVPYLREKLVEAIESAEARLQPAKIGWASTAAPELTALRRWILRPDRMIEDPFGNRSVRANMHVARNLDNVTGPSGPEDSQLSMIALQSVDGTPIAVLANFSMHYFAGEQGLSADYFGLFCENFAAKVAKTSNETSFVAIMSHGCSGDIWRRDYARPASDQREPQIDAYAQRLTDLAVAAFDQIDYVTKADISIVEQRHQMRYRVPDRQRLQWAEQIVAELPNGVPKTREQVYAREQVMLHRMQTTEVVLQAIRVGDIAIAALPTETYALTGLKLKQQSPLRQTMVIELANGACGYIPPPEQHELGGYNTWAARSAGLETGAEPKIVESMLGMLETVCRTPRKEFRQSLGPRAKSTLAMNPVAYWRLDEFEGPFAMDATENGHAALYEPSVAYFLEGPQDVQFCHDDETNRAVHLAGGRLRARIPQLENQDHYSVSLWCWNGMPDGARDVSGWLLSRGRDHRWSPRSDSLAVDGSSSDGSFLRCLDQRGSRKLGRWTWHHVAFVRQGKQVSVYLDGLPIPEIQVFAPREAEHQTELFLGGSPHGQNNWEGRLDEIAIFDRVLSVEEIARLAGHAETARLQQSNNER